jgi:hypothetical protein
LPLLSEGGSGFFEIEGEGNVIESLNLISEEFFFRHKEVIETLSKATNLLGKNIKWFIRVKSDDVKLVDMGIACTVNDKDILKKRAQKI